MLICQSHVRSVGSSFVFTVDKQQKQGCQSGGFFVFLADFVISKNRTARESMGEYGRYHHSLSGAVKLPKRNAILCLLGVLRQVAFLPWERVLIIARTKNRICHVVGVFTTGNVSKMFSFTSAKVQQLSECKPHRQAHKYEKWVEICCGSSDFEEQEITVQADLILFWPHTP